MRAQVQVLTNLCIHGMHARVLVLTNLCVHGMRFSRSVSTIEIHRA
jgi:hypothetical protein